MNARDAIISIMAASPQFADLDPMVLRTIAARCRPKVFLTGQMVFMEGGPCRNLCILESGRVKFFRMNAGGREQILKVFERPGDMFCIASAFSTGIHIVSASAMTETRLHLLDMDAVNRVARDHPSVGLKMVGTAGEHMTHLVALADDLSLKTATGRLAKYLYELAVVEGAGRGVKVRVSRDRLRAEELASLLGTVRVHISRSLTNLADAGAIELDRGFIGIRDLAILRRFSEGK
jgi:CRP/FNR family transcriptional regulator